ncbi:hypothetical protein [Alkalihalobacterium alkalinitrilicum]|uniref:hypothetical protein n=1 Tax=Alkalihalobacterium alkalinitrilicum TaxID=427920 RepID=UPI000A63B127|nr:hypothetical protein [Alkalihalobacterium alkalinitrilicum]
MKEKLITPWDVSGKLQELYVPSNIEEMAQKVIASRFWIDELLIRTKQKVLRLRN